MSPVRPPAGSAPHGERVARLVRRVEESGAGHAIISSPVDVGYLTGFLGGDSYLVVGRGLGKLGAIIVSDARYEEELSAFSSLAEVVIRARGMNETLAEVLASHRVGRCVVQGDHLTVKELEGLRSALGVGSPVELSAVSGLVGAMRVVKDAYEVELIQRAIRIQESALEAVLPSIKPGQSELDVAAMLEAEMKRRGSSRCWFDSIVGAKANGSLPHYRPGFTRVTSGWPLLIDWGATYMGYCGDMTRTFAVGKWSRRMREVYEIVREAQQMAADALAPGRRAHEIDRIARDHIERHGYELGHGLGHGLGMVKEPPFLNPLYPDMVLEVGHVLTVEPGIYIPGVGGVRIEDQYVITATGARNFCRLPKDAEWSTL